MVKDPEKVEKKEKILVLSDAHIAGEWTNFPAYQAQILELMTHYDHVVMNGDDWELFRIKKDHVQSLSDFLEMLTHRPSHKWQKDFDLENTSRGKVENVIHGAKWFTKEFLDMYPNVQLHIVGGNHEHVRRFHKVFKAIEAEQRERAADKKIAPNFEWSPEAVRIGDALFTHGHLPMSGKPYTKKTVDEDMPDEAGTYRLLRLNQAENSQKWTTLFKHFVSTEHALSERLWGKRETAVKQLLSGLQKWDGTDDFSVSHNGIHTKLKLDEVKHIFFGHTHIKFDNFEEKVSGKIFHNTGAIVDVASRKPEDLGILEVDLEYGKGFEEGKVAGVRPVKLAKPHDRSQPKPPSTQTQR